MRISRGTLAIVIFIFLLFASLLFVKLPVYIYKPGGASELSQIVEVKHGYKSKGELHLVTVSRQQATPLLYMLAKFQSYQDIVPIDDAIPDGYTEEEYHHYQMKMMESSHNAAVSVAYKAADYPVSIENNGVRVIHVMEDMPAKNIVEVDDEIIAVDSMKILEAHELVSYVQSKKLGDIIELTIKREDETFQEKIKLSVFPHNPEQVGIGIQLHTNKKIEAVPPVEINSGNIGGPSAGLMFALEIYDQLTNEDITRGYKIAGTGEIDFSGKVLRIGGVDKKVVAADKEDIEIFFVPNEEGADDSNYEVAKETARKINSKMKIIPVDSFAEALEYLKQLEPKSN